MKKMSKLNMSGLRKVVVHDNTGLFYGHKDHLCGGYAWVSTFDLAIIMDLNKADEQIMKIINEDLPEKGNPWSIKIVEVIVFFEE